MNKCINCKHLKPHDVCICEVDVQVINFPRFMGGPKKCECYEKREKIKKEKFKYPKKK